MILTRSELAIYRNMKGLGIEPFRQECFQPASYDVHLGDTLMYVVPDKRGGHWVEVPVGEVTIKPCKLYLACTEEKITLPKNMAAILTGKSSLARMGVMNNITAGYLDPGYSGNPTLELVWFDTYLKPTAGMEIGQVIFFETKSPSQYEGHYQGDTSPRPSYSDARPIADIEMHERNAKIPVPPSNWREVEEIPNTRVWTVSNAKARNVPGGNGVSP